MHSHPTTNGLFWPEAIWPPARPTVDQPGTFRKQLWALHVFHHHTSVPSGDSWEWCPFFCFPHLTSRPGEVRQEVQL